jgi:predicted glycoside hydrolase/deacetylase ChbG (UPF0249 family)
MALNHLDSHNDIHTSPAIASLVVDVARALGITRVRPARNCGPRQGLIRWVHHHRYNASLSRMGLNRVDYFGTIDDLVWLTDRGSVHAPFFAEAMTHPRLNNGDGLLVDAPFMQSLAHGVRQLRNRGFGVVERAGSARHNG